MKLPLFVRQHREWSVLPKANLDRRVIGARTMVESDQRPGKWEEGPRWYVDADHEVGSEVKGPRILDSGVWRRYRGRSFTYQGGLVIAFIPA